MSLRAPYTLFRKEVLRFKAVALQTVVAPVITALLYVIVFAQMLSRGAEIKINWPGRLGVAPTMGAPFFAMAGVHWLALILLYVGMSLALLATVMYVRIGVMEIGRKVST